MKHAAPEEMERRLERLLERHASWSLKHSLDAWRFADLRQRAIIYQLNNGLERIQCELARVTAELVRVKVQMAEAVFSAQQEGQRVHDASASAGTPLLGQRGPRRRLPGRRLW